LEYGQSKRFLDGLADWEAGRPAGGPVEHNLPRVRRLLTELGNPERSFRSIIVGGTNGKGTTASYLAHLLKTQGRRVGLYTSPHLHSIRERIQVDGIPIEREIWAEGVTHLHGLSSGFENAGYGQFTKFEALTALSALLFKRDEVEFGVFEVGLGGRYDATNAWDSDVSILTSVQLDHTEILGNTLEAIARDKLQITRPGRPLFTPQDHEDPVPDLIVSLCGEKDVPVVWVDPTAAYADAPDWVSRNRGLAVEVARHLVGATDIEQADRTYQWPGRCEVASEEPLVILDGAHNPAAAAALVEHLRKQSASWRFVVGVTKGHQEEGVLTQLAAIADEFLITTSDHPRSLDSHSLLTAVPDGVNAKIIGSGSEFLRRVLSESTDIPTCVTGSLHLVAKAREVLGLVEEREGISEDVLLESLRCLEMAADRVGLSLQAASDDGNVIRVEGSGSPLYFMRNKHPFNDYVSARLAEDKAYQYELFLNAGIPVPYTMKLFNPYADERFSRYQDHVSVADMVYEIESQMSYPLVVKRNQGSFAQGIYLEHNRKGLNERLELLFRHSGYLNNILICQSFVVGREYRAVVSGREVLLVYEKQGPLIAEAGGDLNPLHRPGGKAVKAEEPELLKSFGKAAQSIAEVLNLGFYAIDAIASVGGLFILEVNPNPVCYFYNNTNGRADFVRIYGRLLRQFAMESAASRDVTLELDDQ
jgi:dihydrofolate synthase/folylpolyglutamate synthase